MNCLAGEEALPQFFDKYARTWDFFKRLRDAIKMKIVIKAFASATMPRPPPRELIQPILLFELFGKVALGQILKIFVREGIELELESGGEHPFDFILPFFFLKPLILHELSCPVDVFVVELDADVARQPVAIGIGAGEADELGLGDGHALAFKSEIDGPLFDNRVDVVAPGIVVDQDVNRKIVFFVQSARKAPDAAGRLAVTRKQNAVVSAPELVFRKPVPLGAFLDEEDEIRRAFADLNVFRLYDRGNRITAFA